MSRSSLVLVACVLGLVSLAGCATEASVGEESSAALVTEDAHVQFTSDSWEPTWSAAPRAGGNLVVDYDFGRLPQCRNESTLDSWVVEVNWRFDGEEIHTEALPGSPGAGTALANSRIAIPPSARSIELWFENRAVGGYYHCSAWDSRYGANYDHLVD
jgi:hypothetical protein